jgi:(R,R)-butanediol dehydrogenase/meso-butanediol dehydrogenase/diacetyl reductase
VRAVRYHGTRDVRVDEIEAPVVRPGSVKVAPEWCGICGSDVHEYLSGPETIPAVGNPHPITGEVVPVVLGHEFAGRVVEVGAGVHGVAVGDPVAVEPIIRDNTCPYCVAGDYNYCASIGFHGLSGGGGGLADFTVVPEYMVHRLPDTIPTDIGALVEPLAVGWHAVRRAEFEPGQTALVVGAGPIGLVTLLALRDAGASFVAVAEISPARKAKAEEMGADVVLDPTRDDVVAVVQARTAKNLGGPGADATFDASGHQATLTLALQAVRKRGRVVNVALWEHPAEIDMFKFLFTEATLTSSCAYANDHAAVIGALASGRIDASPLITKRIGFDQVVAEGLESLAHSRDRDVKILVQP